ncbi:transcriptional regulator, SarA/Rot family [Sphingopyxis solisilvae]|uniref:transcriptional regulator, SarA/Rot family n=1 Tax=Sphingopyxis solisilvae TaxID=1886788 RepID=UPI00389AAE50
MSGTPDHIAAAATHFAGKAEVAGAGYLRCKAAACARGHGNDDGALLAAAAEAEYARRRRRDARFGGALFADPAWDMLLDLFVHHHRGKQVSSHSLCIAAAVPQTTALRWIGKLRSAGLVTRVRSREDQRVVHVLLTEQGLERMTAHLRSETEREAPSFSRTTETE